MAETTTQSSVERVAVAFVAELRTAGIAVPVQATITFVRALGELDPSDRAALYWAGRATLVVRHEDMARYDEVFRSFWGQAPRALTTVLREEQVVALGLDEDAAVPGPEPHEAVARPVLALRYSPREVLAGRDFAECSPAELAEAYRLMQRFAAATALRRSRRHLPAGRRGGRPDLRRTVRDSVRSGGEMLRRSHTRPGRRPRRLVLLLDVSGSMEQYSRPLLRFAHSAVSGRTQVEAFTLGTRLTRITRDLSLRDPDAALERAASAVLDWSGGTRLGEMIGEFNRRWGLGGMARGAVVVILSDGWDRGEPEVMREEMARLSRAAHRVIWVNPLKASPGYEPLARGMAAALPYVDSFLEGHSLDALEALAEEVGA